MYIQGVSADGVVDTAADITIMGGKLFTLVASPARLHKKDFKTPDRVPRTYDRKVPSRRPNGVGDLFPWESYKNYGVHQDGRTR